MTHTLGKLLVDLNREFLDFASLHCYPSSVSAVLPSGSSFSPSSTAAASSELIERGEHPDHERGWHRDCVPAKDNQIFFVVCVNLARQ